MTIQIQIKDPILRNYLLASSKVNDDGSLVVSNATIVGSVICSVVGVCNFVPPKREDEDLLLFDIPLSSYTSDLRNHFLLIKPEGEKCVNNVLRHEFNMVLLNYCNVKISQGVKLKTALYDFLSDYNLIDFMDFQTIKKRHYRASVDAINEVHARIRNRFYYLSDKYSQKK